MAMVGREAKAQRRPETSGCGSEKPVVYTIGCQAMDCHEERGHDVLARRIAAHLRYPYGGEQRPGKAAEASYLVPRWSLAGLAARPLDTSTFFGGWTAQPFMATKAIMHPLIADAQRGPQAWPAALSVAAEKLVLPGFTAFDRQDAVKAGRAMLKSYPDIRLKQVFADGGRGQDTASSLGELLALIDRIPPDAMEAGLVIEENLDKVVTMSVGRVNLGEQTISYFGHQSSTTDNEGKNAYGGSSLFAVQGGFETLLQQDLPDIAVAAVTRAAAFDRLADRHLEGFLASRRNYDVAMGFNHLGETRMGVLEQSWRIGGASGAEILAMEAFAARPNLTAVQVATVERYGVQQEVPGDDSWIIFDDSWIIFEGEDPKVGPLLKFARVEARLAG